MRRLLLILALLTGAASAQQGNTVALTGAGAPTGNCAFMFIYTNSTNGDFYNCFNGSWLKVNGAGGGGNVSTGQTNVYTGGFLQDFSAATMELPEAAAFVSTVDSTVGFDTNTQILHFWGPGAADSFNVVTSSTSTTTTQPIFATATAGLYAPRAIAAGDLPSSGIANVVYNNAANTAATGMTLDMSAATGATALKMPVIAGATAGADGVIDYDSTNKNTHVRTNAADSIVCAFSAAPVTLDLVSVTVASGNTLCSDAGFLASNVVRKDAVNATAAAFTLNMSASTAAGAFRSPAQAGCSATSTGAVCYDTTAALTHVSTSGQDASIAPVMAKVTSTSQTAAITTATLCSAAACGTSGGQYEVHFDLWGGGTACSSVTAGKVQFLLTWTDENAVTHSAVALQMTAQTGAATTAVQDNMPFQTALANEGAGGVFTFSTNGTIIQYATAYTACTTGTGTYGVRASVNRVQ